MTNNQPQMIYKYISKNGIERLIKTKSLSFTRIDKWDDVYEGVMLKVIMSDPRLKNERKRIATIIPKIVYAQSWTHRAEESDAMWKIFAKASGARIGVYTSSICNLIRSRFHGKFDMIESGSVSYRGVTEVYQTDKENIQSALLHKNTAYDYEHEYRFGLYNSSQWLKLKSILCEADVDRVSDLLCEIEKEVDLNEDYLDYGLEDDTIREMILHYDSSDDDLQNIEQKCKNLGLILNSLGRSNLHDNGLYF